MTTTTESEAKPILPQKVDDIQIAFPADIKRLMVPYDDIPEDFRRGRGAASKWVHVQQEWFYRGLKGAEFKPKPGIDQRTALRQLSAIQGSYEPKHEHKEACVAYLLSLWFDDVKLAARP